MTTWPERAAQARADGWTVVDVLIVIDRVAHREVELRLLRPDTGAALTLTEVAVDDRVPSLASRLPGVAWHEREAAELVGVTFVGQPDPRPLLREAEATPPSPLRRATPLPARVEHPWPGAHDPVGGRRRASSPGVLPEWPA